jgi:hypothetical protein
LFTTSSLKRESEGMLTRVNMVSDAVRHAGASREAVRPRTGVTLSSASAARNAAGPVIWSFCIDMLDADRIPPVRVRFDSSSGTC